MYIEVMPRVDLADGTMTVVDVAGNEILMVQLEGRVFALDSVCTHAEGWLEMGTLLAATCEIECPLHDGRFNLETGEPTRDPCTVALRTYPVKESAGLLYVDTG